MSERMERWMKYKILKLPKKRRRNVVLCRNVLSCHLCNEGKDHDGILESFVVERAVRHFIKR